MVSERIVAHFSNEGDPGKAAHIKTLASNATESVIQTVWVVVNLVGADTTREKRVGWSTAFFEKGEVDALVQLHRELGSWEVAGDLLHRLLLDARVVGRLKLQFSIG